MKKLTSWCWMFVELFYFTRPSQLSWTELKRKQIHFDSNSAIKSWKALKSCFSHFLLIPLEHHKRGNQRVWFPFAGQVLTADLFPLTVLYKPRPVPFNCLLLSRSGACCTRYPRVTLSPAGEATSLILRKVEASVSLGCWRWNKKLMLYCRACS